jgi:hypothetical protein
MQKKLNSRITARCQCSAVQCSAVLVHWHGMVQLVGSKMRLRRFRSIKLSPAALGPSPVGCLQCSDEILLMGPALNLALVHHIGQALVISSTISTCCSTSRMGNFKVFV